MSCKSCKPKIFKWKYIKNFIKFIYIGIKSGFKTVSFEEYNNRLNMCMGCMFLSPDGDRCTDCGCWIKNKAKWKVEDCPQGFWRK